MPSAINNHLFVTDLLFINYNNDGIIFSFSASFSWPSPLLLSPIQSMTMTEWSKSSRNRNCDIIAILSQIVFHAILQRKANVGMAIAYVMALGLLKILFSSNPCLLCVNFDCMLYLHSYQRNKSSLAAWIKSLSTNFLVDFLVRELYQFSELIKQKNMW